MVFELAKSPVKIVALMAHDCILGRPVFFSDLLEARPTNPHRVGRFSRAGHRHAPPREALSSGVDHTNTIALVVANRGKNGAVHPTLDPTDDEGAKLFRKACPIPDLPATANRREEVKAHVLGRAHVHENSEEQHGLRPRVLPRKVVSCFVSVRSTFDCLVASKNTQ